jgi:hypothetical protein
MFHWLTVKESKIEKFLGDSATKKLILEKNTNPRFERSDIFCGTKHHLFFYFRCLKVFMCCYRIKKKQRHVKKVSAQNEIMCGQFISFFWKEKEKNVLSNVFLSINSLKNFISRTVQLLNLKNEFTVAS